MKKKIANCYPFLSATFSVLILLRIIGIILITQSQYIEHPAILFFAGLFHDLLFVLALFPIIFLIELSGSRKLQIAFTILTGILLVFDLISIFYFNVSLYPIDRTIYQFSASELLNIVETFGEFRWYYLLAVFPVPLLFLLIRFLRNHTIWTYLLLLPAVGTFIIYAATHQKIGSDFEQLFAKNGAGYFIADSYEYFANTSEPKLVAANDDSYALIHPVDERNTLGPYFQLKKEPPNLVFLMIESLSSTFSGPRADQISLTPFLDSLSQHSLYFDHFISTAERTFGVLPASLASLPHGKKGFLKMGMNMPAHQSIISLLTKNGYNATFFYGGDADYDDMRTFMENNGVKTIVDNHKAYSAAEANWNKEGGMYGKSDQLFFEDAANEWQHNLKPPFIHCYLTLSTHQPFKIENQKHYEALAQSLIKRESKEKGINPDRYSNYLQIFSTFVYTDEAIKKLISRYKKEDSFDNTIFFIYGDHMMGPFPKKNGLEKYEVPLYIYSPLLKKPKTIGAVNSHLDIAPSVFSLLNHKYAFDFPEEVHWIGHPFDMNSKTDRNREVVLMLNNRETPDFLANELFLSKGKLYQLDTNLDTHILDNPVALDSVEHVQDSLIFVQTNALEKNELIRKKTALTPLWKKQEHDAVFSQTETYVRIFNYPLQKDQEALSLKIKLNFEHIGSDTIPKIPLVVLTIISPEGKTLMWSRLPYTHSDDSSGFTTNIDRYFKNSSRLPLTKGTLVKMYFWNNKESNTKFRVIDSDVQLSAIKE